ncbi:MAG: hypothetical protein HYR67_18150 [Bacteroidetes bacterium]|nr:hypothetical protein [Bacteroidota bacterium]
MKNLQTSILKIIAYSFLFFCACTAYAQNAKIKEADSLFKAKQYIQSLEHYQSVFDEKKYTPAMLLKMAYINEGLGKIGSTLYFVKLYYLASEDEQALKKAEEIAAKFKLSGYEVNDASRLQRWIAKNTLLIQMILILALFGIAFIIFTQRKQNQKPWGAFTALVLVMGMLFYSNNFYSLNSVIVTSDKTYLMDGPSAGAHVIAVISEGSLLHSMGREDVWLKVKWIDKEAYVKENAVKELSL